MIFCGFWLAPLVVAVWEKPGTDKIETVQILLLLYRDFDRKMWIIFVMMD